MHAKRDIRTRNVPGARFTTAADRTCGLILGIALLAIGPAAGAAAPAATGPDSSLTLSGDADGTAFRSMTIEADNRVQVHFDRPELVIDLDPATAPGLTWGDAQDVLDRTVPDLLTPYLADSSRQPSPYAARPWLAAFVAGPVVVIRPELDGVDRWTLTIIDARGQEVHRTGGKGNPPGEITWDGQTSDGRAALPGLTYSFVIEASDRAGNKRRFVGDPFTVAAYRLDGDAGPEFLVAGRDWDEAGRNAPGGRSAYVLETASRLNLAGGAGLPVVVAATARTVSEAERVGNAVAAALAPLLPGGEQRIAVRTLVEAGAPAGGVLHIATGTSGP